ncbi:J domain-containing protein [Roseateles depolymerans]|uniref:Uncharacterized protein n=1 Tax=Roseateles depolymerans TaxID=76731 RepID=A0A0U3MC32_9BURK|nr:J domain-containing protein [Roseateles depolymerans]ALV05913.1 hypothetical protein RD2015_1424 [Roseateles depolymerans]REG12813.1 hypothetical protein DES44_4184 [Roseateles depolymerans]
MTSQAITPRELDARREALAELQRQLADEEQAYATTRRWLQAFIDRYVAALGPLYMELDSLESQLYCAMRYLHDALSRNGVDTRPPEPPRATGTPLLPQLPPGAPLPPQPEGGLVQVGPPPLKTLYRRAAMRLHPDLAPDDQERRIREQKMVEVNEAYAASDRPRLEQLLLAAGESAFKVKGGDADAVLSWLRHAERSVQGRLRVVQAHTALLVNHQMHQLGQAIERAERKGLQPLTIMANRLRAQITERRQELYIGQRLQPESGMAEAFLRQRQQRMGGGIAASF